MNYISETKAFYDWLETNPLPAPAIALWHALMSIANKTGWQEKFAVAVSVLELKAGLNAQAVKRARNTLKEAGRIEWSARKGNQSAVYRINSFVVQNHIENVPQSEPQPVPQSEPQPVPQSEPINKQNETRQNETKSIGRTAPARRSFTPPTVEEISAYCKERGNRVDPQQFFDFYESKGWMVGKNRMKDWKAAVRTWERREPEKPDRDNWKGGLPDL